MNHFEFIPENDFLPPEELAAVQERYLREHLEFCRTHSPYYRKLFGNRDFSSFPLNRLSELPLTDKSDLAKQSDEFWTIEDDWISYFIYPDISWDELATFDRRRGDPFYPYRGVGYYYIGVTIRPQMDTINVWYGLSRH